MNRKDIQNLEELKDTLDDFKEYINEMKSFAESNSENNPLYEGYAMAFGHVLKYTETILEKRLAWVMGNQND